YTASLDSTPLPPLSFVSSTPLPAPTSTLFPYTTLFRSDALQQAGSVDESLLEAATFGTSSDDWITPTEDDTAAANTLLGERWAEDRKSTRLNSSHVSISYAVFCLKKKTTCVGLRRMSGT